MFVELPEETDLSEKVFTISDLNKRVKQLLETGLPRLVVSGEISNYMRASSGHMYFSLKDARAQVSCAMFKGHNRRLTFNPENGMEVQATVRVTMYEPRGNYQLIVESMTEAGDGALKREFELLKQKLNAEGLFDEARKQPLPSFPQNIAIVTSEKGAALRDILHVLERRFPMSKVDVFSCLVQGKQAAKEITQQINLVSQYQQHDVLLVARGGGSLEDLWSFNDEAVARAIVACPIPVVTGIGHEIDFTIADFVADVRAPTPSAAAEIISPDLNTYLQQLKGLDNRLQMLLQNKLSALHDKLHHLKKRLQHPGDRLERYAQRVDECEIRLKQAMLFQLSAHKQSLVQLQIALHANNPMTQIKQLKLRRAEYSERLFQAMKRNLKQQSLRFSQAAKSLDALSPLSTLGRGYAIVRKEDTILQAAKDVASGDNIEVQLHQGKLNCQVMTKEDI